MNSRKLTSVFLVCALVGLIAAPVLGQSKGTEFPNFKGKHLVTGDSFSLEDLRGKIVLIDFWATWCGPCIGELPNVKKTYAKYHDKGFEIVSISLDKDVKKCLTYVKKQDMDWYHIAEGGGWETRLAKKFNIRSIPAMYLLDANGVVVSTKARGAALATAIEAAMKRTPPMLGDVTKHADEALVAADELRAQKKYVEAVQAYDVIIDKYSSTEAAETAAERRSEMLADETAAAAIEEAEQSKKQAQAVKHASSWMAMARSLAKAKRYAGAKKYYQRVIDRLPDSELAIEAKHEMSKLP
jgi:thioredoxin-like negative regulator of GroEL